MTNLLKIVMKGKRYTWKENLRLLGLVRNNVAITEVAERMEKSLGGIYCVIRKMYLGDRISEEIYRNYAKSYSYELRKIRNRNKKDRTYSWYCDEDDSLLTRCVNEDVGLEQTMILLKRTSYSNVGSRILLLESQGLIDKEVGKLYRNEIQLRYLKKDYPKKARKLIINCKKKSNKKKLCKRFGFFLRELLKINGMSQVELAREIGTTRARVNNWIHGYNAPHPKLWRKLAEALSIKYKIFKYFIK